MKLSQTTCSESQSAQIEKSSSSLWEQQEGCKSKGMALWGNQTEYWVCTWGVGGNRLSSTSAQYTQTLRTTNSAQNQFKDGRNDVLERENMTTVLQQLIRQHTANVRHTDPSSHDNILLLTSFSEGWNYTITNLSFWRMKNLFHNIRIHYHVENKAYPF